MRTLPEPALGKHVLAFTPRLLDTSCLWVKTVAVTVTQSAQRLPGTGSRGRRRWGTRQQRSAAFALGIGAVVTGACDMAGRPVY